jgi:hypothetical protein
MLDATKIRREIARLYEKDPEGWRVLVGRDRSGFYDALISHGTGAWQVKEYQVNPYKFVGLGSRLPNLPSGPLSPQEHPFGLRAIDLDQIKEIASVIDDPKSISEFAEKLLSRNPVSAREAVESPAVLQGPILQSPGPLEALSSAHTRLDAKLRKELQKLVNKEFRHTVTPYL